MVKQSWRDERQQLNLDNRKSTDSQVTQINYQTTYQHQTYQKTATIYLPAAYQANQRHNIIYMLHGSTESGAEFFATGHFKQILDQLSQQKELSATIVVFPTYYPSSAFVKNNYYADYPLTQQFATHELLSDLIPAVEGTYRTYATGTSKPALQASRAHRAFGGFSMGAITTWEVFEHDLAYFQDFMPLAGDSWTIESDGGATASTHTAQQLAEAVEPTLPFKLLAGVGSNDGTRGSMQPQIEAMWRLSVFNQQNLQWTVQPGGQHTPQSIGQQFQHYASELF